jgi:DNA ligase (NAD+)
MDIDGLGSETVEQFVKQGLIKDAADLYDLDQHDLLPLERMAEKSAQNIIDGIAASKEVPFERLLFALGIRYVGETVAKKLARHFETLDALMSADKEALVSVSEIGERIADSLLEYFSKEQHQELLQRLQHAGLQFKVAEREDASNVLSGLKMVISGSFERFSRSELKELIELHGGKNTGSVSKATDYIVAGEGMGPKKREKAEALGVKIIDENEFAQMIGKL